MALFRTLSRFPYKIAHLTIISWYISTLIISVCCADALHSRNLSDVPVPVVFIVYGDIPSYLRINIEITTLKNDVYIIANDLITAKDIAPNPRLSFFNMSEYNISATEFDRYYVPYLISSSDQDAQQSELHKSYQIRCFYRWFILREFMMKHKIDIVFYSDNDNIVFVNVAKASSVRKNCSAMINIELQNSLYHWVGAGEASFWTIPGLTSFLSFTETIYKNHQHVFTEKRKTSNIVDMTLLWLWWVAHFEYPSLESGRPFADKLASEAFDLSFNKTKSYGLPLVDDLQLCNGMDALFMDTIRTAFDHMHGYNIPSYDIDDYYEMPFVTGAALPHGGKPENIEQSYRYTTDRIYLNNLHYQGGGGKKRMMRDGCLFIRRFILQSTKRSRQIFDKQVEQYCMNIH